MALAEVFDAVIYFCYTDRKNVRSATLPGKVAGEELRQRIDEIVAHPSLFVPDEATLEICARWDAFCHRFFHAYQDVARAEVNAAP